MAWKMRAMLRASCLNKNAKKIVNKKWKYLPGIHLAIDTNEDFKKAESIFKHAGGDYKKINFSFINKLVKEEFIN